MCSVSCFPSSLPLVFYWEVMWRSDYSTLQDAELCFCKDPWTTMWALLGDHYRLKQHLCYNPGSCIWGLIFHKANVLLVGNTTPSGDWVCSVAMELEILLFTLFVILSFSRICHPCWLKSQGWQFILVIYIECYTKGNSESHLSKVLAQGGFQQITYWHAPCVNSGWQQWQALID